MPPVMRLLALCSTLSCFAARAAVQLRCADRAYFEDGSPKSTRAP